MAAAPVSSSSSSSSSSYLDLLPADLRAQLLGPMFLLANLTHKKALLADLRVRCNRVWSLRGNKLVRGRFSLLMARTGADLDVSYATCSNDGKLNTEMTNLSKRKARNYEDDIPLDVYPQYKFICSREMYKPT